jgi:hypothetical protein
MARACQNDCGLTCGAFTGFPFGPDTADACEACLVSKGCSAIRDCAISPDCDAILRCQALCATLDCRNACSLAHGGEPAYASAPDAGPGRSDFSNAFAAGALCASQCGVGSDWRCVGHVSWPTIHSVSGTYHFSLQDFATALPVPGATVTLCAAEDVHCASKIATDVTNDAGSVSLPFTNTPGSGGQQELGLTGFLRITAPTIVDYYYYWGFPLSEAQVYSYGETITPDELQGRLTNQQVTQDPGRGILSVAVYDCDYNDAAAVQVTLDVADARTQAFTLPAGVETSTTDSKGILLFTNVLVGTVHVTVTPLAIGRASGSTKVDVRAGAVTGVLVAPTP